MTIEKTSRLEAIQFAEDGTLFVRIQKRTSLDGEVMKEEWHRTSIAPDADPAAQMATVNEHLSAMGFQPVDAKPLALLSTIAADVQTAEVKDAFRAKMEAPAPIEEVVKRG